MRIRGAKVAKTLCVYLYGQSIYGITTHIIKKTGKCVIKIIHNVIRYL